MAISIDLESVEQIPQLLHDATALNFCWDEPLRQIEINFSCMRCDDDGNAIDRPITMQLQNVFGLAVFNSIPRFLDAKKPDTRPTKLVTAEQLMEWNKSSQFWLSVNSLRGRLEFDTALQVSWLYGSEPKDADLTIHFVGNMGSLQVQCDEIVVHDNGQLLTIEQWSEQFGNWWKAWKGHWDNRGNDDQTMQSQFEYAIPTAPDSHPPTVQKPLDLVVWPDDLDAPEELLAPIRDYLAGLQQGDWLRAARAFPDLDASDQACAQRLSARNAAGPWLYAREIDQWWSEDNYACVTVRGVEYEPETDEPASALETVVNYELRKFQDRWILWNLSQGWVKYGSAPGLKSRRPWHDQWSIPSHLPKRGREPNSGLPQNEHTILSPFQTVLFLIGFGILLLALIYGISWIK